MGPASVRKCLVFEWTPKRIQAAMQLAEGYKIREVSKAIGVSERSIGRWKQDVEFAAEVDRLSLMVGMASRAERLRLANRIIRAKNGRTKKDLLEWVRFAQSETDGAKLDLAAFGEALVSMADGEQAGAGGDAAGESEDALSNPAAG
jgi:hypothetical protein